MLVTRENIESVLAALEQRSAVAVDTETTGLRAHHGDRPFAVILAVAGTAYYFPVGVAAGIDEERCLGAREILWMGAFLAAPRRYYLANAKFDLHMLATMGLSLGGEIHDVQVAARLIQSDLPSYSLDAIGAHFLGERKDDKVKAYIDEHHLWEWVETPNLSRRAKAMYFDRVPLEIMQPYAEQDGILTYRLGEWQDRKFAEIDSSQPRNVAAITRLWQNEKRLTRTVYEMEARGIRVDRTYCETALAHEQTRLVAASARFREQSGEDYKASSKLFERLLASHEDKFEYTDKGNAKFDKTVLPKIDDPLSQLILTAKDAKARLNFYAGFLAAIDASSRIHTDFKQNGAKTGRFSSSNPNLQNLKRNDEDSEADEADTYPVRGAFIPDDEESILVSIDYSQIEYRVMLDYAGEMKMIAAIKSGIDVHQATADLVGISRQRAKTLNFALLYGAGVGKIAAMLGISGPEARALIEQYFAALPSVRAFIREVQQIAKTRGWTYNWYGRRQHYTDRGQAYAAVNHLIQGACADILRVAMNDCRDLLVSRRSKLLLTVHDELIFNMHRSELGLIAEIAKIMEGAYPYRYLPLAVSVSYCPKSLAAKLKSLPEAAQELIAQLA